MTMFRVTDLKQFEFCPRLIFYHYCWPEVRPVTAKMVLGQEAQSAEEVRAARRSLKRYGLTEGREESAVRVESERLGLRGTVDLVIETDLPQSAGQKKELIPVDYKLSTRQAGNHFKLQLLAYGLMLTEKWGMPSERGFLYSIPKREAVEVKFTTAMRTKLEQVVTTMKEVVLREQMPAPTPERNKCGVCEFRRFCNDVY